jgi:hypothetical protein
MPSLRKWNMKLSNRLKPPDRRDPKAAPTEQSTGSQTKDDAKGSRLLSLPGEIRNLVYGSVLYPDKPSFYCVYYSNPQDLFCTILQPALFRVNRQIRDEALALICSQKTFTFLNLQAALVVLRSIEDSGRQNLQNVALTISSLSRLNVQIHQELIDSVKSLKRLRRFRLEFGSMAPVDRVEDEHWDLFASLRKALEDQRVDFTWYAAVPSERANSVLGESNLTDKSNRDSDWVR